MRKNNIIYVALLYLLVLASCKVEKVMPVTEPVKDITGSWKVVKALRNGTDITSLNGVDVTKFRLNFTGDSFTLENKIPFIVSSNGKFKLDDPNYPLEITFNADASDVKTFFSYPTLKGVRSMELKFSPGCNSNVYIYTLQKAN